MNDSPGCPDCPLCGRGVESRTDLRVHLMCNHRKSELTDQLLDTVEEPSHVTP